MKPTIQYFMHGPNRIRFTKLDGEPDKWEVKLDKDQEWEEQKDSRLQRVVDLFKKGLLVEIESDVPWTC